MPGLPYRLLTDSNSKNTFPIPTSAYDLSHGTMQQKEDGDV